MNVMNIVNVAEAFSVIPKASEERGIQLTSALETLSKRGVKASIATLAAIDGEVS
jgi:hypothetical protein